MFDGIKWNSIDSFGKPLYSDHAALVHSGVFCWNVMIKCRRSDTSTNNGYGVTETSAEYKLRLLTISQVIALAVKTRDIKIIALQEVPSKDSAEFEIFLNFLKVNLGSDFIVSAHNAADTPGTTSSRLTIFHKALNVKDITPKYNAKLGAQQGRAQIFECAYENQKFCFANCHMAYGKDIQTAMNNMMNDGLIVAGDFNAPVASFGSRVDVKSHELNGANFSFDVNQNRSNPVTQYDAVVFSKKCEFKAEAIKEKSNVASNQAQNIGLANPAPDNLVQAQIRRNLFKFFTMTPFNYFNNFYAIAAAGAGLAGLFTLVGLSAWVVGAVVGTWFATALMNKLSIAVNKHIAAYQANDKNWINSHKEAFELGVKSQSWIPYLKSSKSLAAYTAPYQVGLMHKRKDNKRKLSA